MLDCKVAISVSFCANDSLIELNCSDVLDNNDSCSRNFASKAAVFSDDDELEAAEEEEGIAEEAETEEVEDDAEAETEKEIG